MAGESRWRDTAENAAAAGVAGMLVASPATAAAGVAAVVLTRVVREEFGEIYATIRGERADEFVNDLTTLADTDIDGIVERIRTHQRIGELVELGLEASMRSAAREKRWLHSAVVASALRGPDDARLDEHAVVLRTIIALEPYDVRALVRIATPESGQGACGTGPLAGSVRIDELADALPDDQADLADPIAGHLMQEQLISDVGLGTYGYRPSYRVTPYGRRVLQFLAGGPLHSSKLDHGEATLVLTSPAGGFVRNLGPCRVNITDYGVASDGQEIRSGPAISDQSPSVLEPDGEISFDLHPSPAPDSILKGRVAWTDHRPTTRCYRVEYTVASDAHSFRAAKGL